MERDINRDPWEKEAGLLSAEPLSRGQSLVTLEFNHHNTSVDLLNSILQSEWRSINHGNIYLEIRNANYAAKAANGVSMSDVDDCVMRTSPWHNKEYELVSQDPRLLSQGVIITKDQAKELYELSKIKIPGVVDSEPRYTPRLNLILLTNLANQLRQRLPVDSAWNLVKQIREVYAENLANGKMNEQDLALQIIDKDILTLFEGNSPSQFLHERFVKELCEKDEKELHILITRGKPEGLLGQIYKVHTCGVLKNDVDLVVYTNDIKAQAFPYLANLIPCLKTLPITVYDDSPNEVTPYLDLIHDRRVNNIEVVHVRHPDAKRKGSLVNAPQPVGLVECAVTGTKFDRYHPNRVSLR